MGKVGSVRLSVTWLHDPSFDVGYKPSQRPDAMAQLVLNSEENEYRGNDPEHDLAAWKMFPFLFNMRMFAIHEINFYIKDIFAGRKGFRTGDTKDKGAIRMPHIYMSAKQLSPSDATFPGLTLWGVMNVAIMGGAVPQCLSNRDFYRSTMWSIILGTYRGMHQVDRGIRRRNDVLVRQGEHAAKLETFTQRMNRKWQTTFKGEQYLSKQVTAEDSDTLALTPALTGYLEKSSKGPKTPHLFRNWHLVKVEVKGKTLYYYPIEEGSGAITGIARRIPLQVIADVKLLDNGSELVVESYGWSKAHPDRYFRVSTNETFSESSPSLESWQLVLRRDVQGGFDPDDERESDDEGGSDGGDDSGEAAATATSTTPSRGTFARHPNSEQQEQKRRSSLTYVNELDDLTRPDPRPFSPSLSGPLRNLFLLRSKSDVADSCPPSSEPPMTESSVRQRFNTGSSMRTLDAHYSEPPHPQSVGKPAQSRKSLSPKGRNGSSI